MLRSPKGFISPVQESSGKGETKLCFYSPSGTKVDRGSAIFNVGLPMPRALASSWCNTKREHVGGELVWGVL